MIRITAPWGGLANHVGWIIWLHDHNNNTIVKKNISESDYDAIKGDDWPNFSRLTSLQKTDVNAEIWKDLLYNRVINAPIEDKLSYIVDNIYPSTRTWFNWLTMEWEYRDSINGYDIAHHIDDTVTVACTIQPDLALKHYFKLNPSFNYFTPDMFLQKVSDFNQSINDATGLVLDNSVLWNSTLDKDFYDQIVLYFNFTPDYEAANKVHYAWYSLQKKSEQEFLYYVTKLYGEQND